MHAFYDHRVEGTNGNHGILQLTLCDLKAVVNEAERLSALHTLTGIHRSFDILYIATARILEATTFLTFDLHQRKLAGTVRLAVARRAQA